MNIIDLTHFRTPSIIDLSILDHLRTNIGSCLLTIYEKELSRLFNCKWTAPNHPAPSEVETRIIIKSFYLTRTPYICLTRHQSKITARLSEGDLTKYTFELEDPTCFSNIISFLQDRVVFHGSHEQFLKTISKRAHTKLIELDGSIWAYGKKTPPELITRLFKSLAQGGQQ